ncbi:MAG: zf-HC2 domain-containing protein [Actinomycetota bacterium]|nr:zf-HC2 domain-containing protein [Actinomycetota bacterium]
MTHPEELLAAYVDGSLSTQDRAAVETHLASCDHCRGELALARGARSALSSLEEIPAPAGLTQRAIDEAAGVHSLLDARASRNQRRYRVMAFTAAAAMVALLAVTLPHLGGRSPAGIRAANSEGGMALPSAAVPKSLSLELQHVDYDARSLQGLAAAYKSVTFSRADATTSRQPTVSDASTDVRDAAACLATAFPGFNGRLIHLIRATFEGVPAYLGVYTEGGGAEGHPTSLSVRVASVDTCTILSYTKANL